MTEDDAHTACHPCEPAATGCRPEAAPPAHRETARPRGWGHSDRFPLDLPVVAGLRDTAAGWAWLEELPGIVRDLVERWGLRLEPPLRGGSCAWVAPATTPDGSRVVVKVGWPHREAAGEGIALRQWGGRRAVRLLAEVPEHAALLLERCEPGVPLREAALPPRRALAAGAAVLTELWSAAAVAQGALERVEDVCGEWADGVEERAERLRPPYDRALVARGAALLRELPRTAARRVTVHGDFNPGNLLAARRAPWLAIDPKPMVGDPGYDPWPLLAQTDDPFRGPDPAAELRERLAVLADLSGEPAERLAAWASARAVESALWHAAHGRVAAGAQDMARAHVMSSLTDA
ncbi:aminoglycoside phosphotransferase family protein [Streptomyces sp. NPDC059740]|uniref:aminoglycoside phosphotransferase family protein n=1 Tax=Streptomyces sp. NPDC059740 TaxID=3346926 RepID=UPI00365D7A8A